jgi:hypothetical protein
MIIKLLLIFGVLSIGITATVPPIEVHYRRGDMLYMYDCYRATHIDSEMFVYLNYDGEIVGYACALSSQVKVKPFSCPERNVYARSVD